MNIGENPVDKSVFPVLPRYFLKGTLLPYDESQDVEYKAVQISQNPLSTIRSYLHGYLNAFLNSSFGGMIWFGVDDDGYVLGIPLNRSQRDNLRLSCDMIINDMVPQVDASLVHVNFVPVYTPEELEDEDSLLDIQPLSNSRSVKKILLRNEITNTLEQVDVDENENTNCTNTDTCVTAKKGKDISPDGVDCTPSVEREVDTVIENNSKEVKSDNDSGSDVKENSNQNISNKNTDLNDTIDSVKDLETIVTTSDKEKKKSRLIREPTYGVYVMVVYCLGGPAPVYFTNHTRSKAFLRRNGGNREMSPDVIIERELRQKIILWSPKDHMLIKGLRKYSEKTELPDEYKYDYYEDGTEEEYEETNEGEEYENDGNNIEHNNTKHNQKELIDLGEEDGENDAYYVTNEDHIKNNGKRKKRKNEDSMTILSPKKGFSGTSRFKIPNELGVKSALDSNTIEGRELQILSSLSFLRKPSPTKVIIFSGLPGTGKSALCDFLRQIIISDKELFPEDYTSISIDMRGEFVKNKDENQDIFIDDNENLKPNVDNRKQRLDEFFQTVSNGNNRTLKNAVCTLIQILKPDFDFSALAPDFLASTSDINNNNKSTKITLENKSTSNSPNKIKKIVKENKKLATTKVIPICLSYENIKTMDKSDNEFTGNGDTKCVHYIDHFSDEEKNRSVSSDFSISLTDQSSASFPLSCEAESIVSSSSLSNAKTTDYYQTSTFNNKTVDMYTFSTVDTFSPGKKQINLIAPTNFEISNCQLDFPSTNLNLAHSPENTISTYNTINLVNHSAEKIDLDNNRVITEQLIKYDKNNDNFTISDVPYGSFNLLRQKIYKRFPLRTSPNRILIPSPSILDLVNESAKTVVKKINVTLNNHKKRKNNQTNTSSSQSDDENAVLINEDELRRANNEFLATDGNIYKKKIHKSQEVDEVSKVLEKCIKSKNEIEKKAVVSTTIKDIENFICDVINVGVGGSDKQKSEDHSLNITKIEQESLANTYVNGSNSENTSYLSINDQEESLNKSEKKEKKISIAAEAIKICILLNCYYNLLASRYTCLVVENVGVVQNLQYLIPRGRNVIVLVTCRKKPDLTRFNSGDTVNLFSGTNLLDISQNVCKELIPIRRKPVCSILELVIPPLSINEGGALVSRLIPDLLSSVSKKKNYNQGKKIAQKSEEIIGVSDNFRDTITSFSKKPENPLTDVNSTPICPPIIKKDNPSFFDSGSIVFCEKSMTRTQTKEDPLMMSINSYAKPQVSTVSESTQIALLCGCLPHVIKQVCECAYKNKMSGHDVIVELRKSSHLKRLVYLCPTLGKLFDKLSKPEKQSLAALSLFPAIFNLDVTKNYLDFYMNNIPIQTLKDRIYVLMQIGLLENVPLRLTDIRFMIKTRFYLHIKVRMRKQKILTKSGATDKKYSEKHNQTVNIFGAVDPIITEKQKESNLKESKFNEESTPEMLDVIGKTTNLISCVTGCESSANTFDNSPYKASRTSVELMEPSASSSSTKISHKNIFGNVDILLNTQKIEEKMKIKEGRNEENIESEIYSESSQIYDNTASASAIWYGNRHQRKSSNVCYVSNEQSELDDFVDNSYTETYINEYEDSYLSYCPDDAVTNVWTVYDFSDNIPASKQLLSQSISKKKLETLHESEDFTLSTSVLPLIHTSNFENEAAAKKRIKESIPLRYSKIIKAYNTLTGTKYSNIKKVYLSCSRSNLQSALRIRTSPINAFRTHASVRQACLPWIKEVSSKSVISIHHKNVFGNKNILKFMNEQPESITSSTVTLSPEGNDPRLAISSVIGTVMSYIQYCTVLAYKLCCKKEIAYAVNDPSSAKTAIMKKQDIIDLEYWKPLLNKDTQLSGYTINTKMVRSYLDLTNGCGLTYLMSDDCKKTVQNNPSDKPKKGDIKKYGLSTAKLQAIDEKKAKLTETILNNSTDGITSQVNKTKDTVIQTNTINEKEGIENEDDKEAIENNENYGEYDENEEDNNSTIEPLSEVNSKTNVQAYIEVLKAKKAKKMKKTSFRPNSDIMNARGKGGVQKDKQKEKQASRLNYGSAFSNIRYADEKLTFKNVDLELTSGALKNIVDAINFDLRATQNADNFKKNVDYLATIPYIVRLRNKLISIKRVADMITIESIRGKNGYINEILNANGIQKNLFVYWCHATKEQFDMAQTAFEQACILSITIIRFAINEIHQYLYPSGDTYVSPISISMEKRIPFAPNLTNKQMLNSEGLTLSQLPDSLLIVRNIALCALECLRILISVIQRMESFFGVALRSHLYQKLNESKVFLEAAVKYLQLKNIVDQNINVASNERFVNLVNSCNLKNFLLYTSTLFSTVENNTKQVCSKKEDEYILIQYLKNLTNLIWENIIKFQESAIVTNL